MRRHISFIAMALALLPLDVIHAGAPPSGGTISVEIGSVGRETTAVTRTFLDAASEALAARGFTILDDPGHAGYVAEMTVRREEVGTARARAPAGSAAAVPGSPGGAGAGVVVPLSSGLSSLVPLQRTVLDLRIRKRGEEGVVWRGTAVTVRSSGGRNGADRKVASDLSEAILLGYPAEPTDIVGVP